MGETTLREVPLRRFYTMGLGGVIGALGVMTMAASPDNAVVVSWIIIADGAFFELLGLRRAFPGNYVRLTADGFCSRSWKWKREVFISWSKVVDIKVIQIGFGHDGYRYPDLGLADGKHAPLYMLATGLDRTPTLVSLLLRRHPYDHHFDAKLQALRDALDAYRARGPEDARDS
ncbi:MAG TPA: hypothetical protein VGH27_17700 [Streptosporangiaceae bacterium]